jgi:hypothetical protein
MRWLAGGAMVMQVVEGSPADKAGLQSFDIITTIGSKPVISVGQLVEKIQRNAPGTKVTLGIIQSGEKKNVEVTLGTEPQSMESGPMCAPPSGESSGRTCPAPGKTMRETPKAQSRQQSLGFGDFAKLFGYVPPESRSSARHEWPGNTESTESFHVLIDRGGKIIEVKGSTGSGLTVERIQPVGTKERVHTETYPNAQALRASDPQAYLLYRDAVTRSLDRDFAVRNVSASSHEKNLRRLNPAQRENLEQTLRTQMRNLREESADFDNWLLAKYEGLVKELHQLQAEGEMRPSHQVSQSGMSGGSPQSATVARQQPAIRFETASDGEITVDIRNKESENLMHFDNANQLRARRPDLYQKYEAVEGYNSGGQPTLASHHHM